MHYELSKPQKKIARALIERGLMKEFHKGISMIDRVIADWKKSKLDNREAYHKIYQKLIKFDKHIGSRYDGISGSTYIYILSLQLADGFISVEDLDELDEKFRAAVLFLTYGDE